MAKFEKYDEVRVNSLLDRGTSADSPEAKRCDELMKEIVKNSAGIITLEDGDSARSYGRLLSSAAARAGAEISTQWFTNENNQRSCAIKVA